MKETRFALKRQKYTVDTKGQIERLHSSLPAVSVTFHFISFSFLVSQHPVPHNLAMELLYHAADQILLGSLDGLNRDSTADLARPPTKPSLRPPPPAWRLAARRSSRGAMKTLQRLDCVWV